MTTLDDVLMRASRAMSDRDFKTAAVILESGLEFFKEIDDKQIILDQLVHCYSHPLNEDLVKAEQYLIDNISLCASAYTALHAAYFYLYVKKDSSAARRWAQAAVRLATEERQARTLFSALAVEGLLAAQFGDLVAVDRILAEMEVSVQNYDEQISYGDAVGFLEAAGQTDPNLAERAGRLAGLIAPMIEDLSFRERAEKLARA